MSKSEEISTMAKERFKELEQMPRAELANVFEDKFGSPPHPKFLIDFMAKAIARAEQDQMWIEATGSVPADVATRNISFWSTNMIALMTKDGLKAERARELVRGKSRETVVVRKEMKNAQGLQGSALTLKTNENPYNEKQNPIPHLIFDILKKNSGVKGPEVSYDVFDKAFKKKNKTNPSAYVLMVQRDGHLDINIPTSIVEEKNVVEIEENVKSGSSVVEKLKHSDIQPKTAVLEVGS